MSDNSAYGLNQRIIQAMAPMELECVPDVYTGSAGTYLQFNFETLPVNFADDAPQHELAAVQVHLFGPLRANLQTLRLQARTLIYNAFGAWPAEQNASGRAGSRDKADYATVDCQHYVFEFSVAVGVPLWP